MAHNAQYYKNLLPNANVKAFLLTIRKGEGTLGVNGYRTMFTGALFNSYADHPNILNSAGSLDSTAAGAYQFLYKTWTPVKKQLSLSDFQPSNQDIACLKLIDGRGALNDVINGKIIDAIDKCNREWASLPGSPYGQPTQSMVQALDFYKASGGFLTKFDEDKVKDMKAYGTGYVAQSTDTAGGTASSSAAGTETNSFTQSLDFSKLAQNIDSQEQDDTTVTWGSRSSNLEESDYIGLKQYLIYLVSRYYPQSLMPFAELIPKFNTDLLNPVDGLTPEAVDALKSVAKSTGLDYQNITNNIKDNLTNDKIIDSDRYERTRKQLKKLNDEGGTDLFTYDPFFEFSDSFNVPNKAGKDIQKKRGLTYKLYGNVVLNPAAEAEGLSKPGAIGLKGITIENGSLTQNGMTLITVKILDVQGNKLLDVNSPWSFMLNQRMDAQDFLFRYGWQVRIPPYDPDNKYVNDPQAAKFWNHIGWGSLFNARTGENNDSWDRGKALKQIIYGMSSKSDNTLTFTQNVTEKSLMNPGYTTLMEDGKVSYRVQRDTNMFDYYSLTLINSDISVNPRDASIEATLVFKTNTAVANCLCPLNGQGLTANFKTKSLVSSKKEVTLAELMNAFVDDNYTHSAQDATKTELAKQKALYYTKQPIDDWLTVIGGMGSDSQLYINPADIKVKISSDLKDEIINATNKDTRLLIEWLNKLLSENDMAILVAADKTSGSQLQSGFVIAYDNDKANQLGGTTKTNAELAQKDITFGDFLTMVENTNRDKQTFIGSRLFVQDDVFSQRFQGSLVEEISVEKLNAPNQASLQANQNFAEGVDPTSVDEGIATTDTETAGSTTTTTTPGKPSAVTLADKKRNLNIIYSQMLGLRVKAICHPWLKLARPCYVKGTGFWDGKYTVMKVQHELGDDGKFISIINAFRVIDSNVVEDKNNKSGINQFAAMNNPGAYKSTPYTGPIPKGSAIKANAPTASLPPGVIPVGEEGKKMQADVLASTQKVGTLSASQEAFLKELHKDYRNHFRAFIKDFQTARPEYRVLITSGYRSFGYQASLYTPTNGNARPGHSMHNYGLAIDLNVVLAATGAVVASKNSSDDSWHNTGILSYAYKYGLTWGGVSFGAYHDRVHFGLDQTFDTNILFYLAKSQYGDNVNNILGNEVKLTIS